MINTVQNQGFKIDQHDIIYFKNILLIFAISQLGGFLANLVFDSLVGKIVNYLGTIVLLYGIYVVSEKYPQMTSGKKVIVLFIFGMIIDIGSEVYIYLFPIPDISQNPSPSEILSFAESFVNYATIITLFLIIDGIVIAISSFYFSDWFNHSFGIFRTTNAFFYYGLIYCAGNIVLAIGVFQIGNVLRTITNNTFNYTATLNSLNIADMIIGIGALILFAAFIAGISASFILYSKVNDSILGKYASPYTGAGSNIFQQQYFQQQPIEQGSFQQQPYQSYDDKRNTKISQVKSNNLDKTNNSDSYCRNCGSKLPPNGIYCGICGNKV